MRARPDERQPFHHHARHLLQARSGVAPTRRPLRTTGRNRPYAPSTGGERSPHVRQTFTTHKRPAVAGGDFLRRSTMGTVQASDRFTSLPDDQALAATVVALEEHGFSVEVVDDRDAARAAVLARIPAGSSVMTNTSVTLDLTGIADAINDAGPYESPRNKMLALDSAAPAH